MTETGTGNLFIKDSKQLLGEVDYEITRTRSRGGALWHFDVDVVLDAEVGRPLLQHGVVMSLQVKDGTFIDVHVTGVSGNGHVETATPGGGFRGEL